MSRLTPPLPALIAAGLFGLAVPVAWSHRPEPARPEAARPVVLKRPAEVQEEKVAPQQASAPAELYAPRPYPTSSPPYDNTYVPEGPIPPPARLGPLTRLKTGVVHRWDGWEDSDNPRSYQVGSVKLTFAYKADRAAKPDDKSLQVTLRAPGVRSAVIFQRTARHSAEFRVGRIDPRRPEPQVLILADTMSNRCCSSLFLASPHKGRWRIEEVLAFDSDDDLEPRDRDGDGIPEIASRDYNFLFAFCDTICNFPPRTIYQIENGQAVDVSRRPAFRNLLLDDVAATTERCQERNNAACAAMVAVASRLGRRREAWATMLAYYDPKFPYGLPSWCAIDPGEEDCPASKLEKYDNFPDALRAFLKHEGYG